MGACFELLRFFLFFVEPIFYFSLLFFTVRTALIALLKYTKYLLISSQSVWAS